MLEPKCNRIEHRMFSFISINRRGRPLISHIDWSQYHKGINIPKAALKDLNITYDDFPWRLELHHLTEEIVCST